MVTKLLNIISFILNGPEIENYKCKATGRVHDYPDSVEGQPWHFTKLTCKYCNLKFSI